MDNICYHNDERDAVLNVQGLHKRYGRRVALDGVDLEVAPGEVCGLLGPNGAGKTTMVSVVAGLLSADAGTVHVGGHDVSAQPRQARELIGYAPQELGIYPIVAVRDNLRLFGELSGLRGTRLRRRIEETAGALGLDHLMDRKAGLLSGGEQRRLHTAVALLHRPALALLDEPTVGADIATRGALLELIRQLADEGTAVCYSTHYLQEVEDLDASVALIHRGRIITRGSVRDVMAAHGDSVLDLRFDGIPPYLELDCPVARDGASLRITTRDPAAVTARALVALGADTVRLQGVEFVRPSLESVFLSLTGERLEPDAERPTAGVAS